MMLRFLSRVSLPGVIVVGVGSFAGQVQAQGLVNGGFEQAGPDGKIPAGWTVTRGTLTQDKNMRKGGSFSGKLDGGNGASAAHQDLVIAPGSSWLLKGVWRNGDRTADFDVARAAILWLSAPGGSELGTAGTVDSGDTVKDWTPFTLGPVTAPAGAGALRLKISATFNTAGFDEITLEPVGAGGAGAAGGASRMPVLPAGTVPTPVSSYASSLPNIAVSPTPAIAWERDIAAAMSRATQSRKRILLLYRAEGNSNSRYYENVLLKDQVIQGILNTGYICIRLDSSLDSAIAARLGLTVPGVIALYDGAGTALDRITDQVSAEAFEKRLK